MAIMASAVAAAGTRRMRRARLLTGAAIANSRFPAETNPKIAKRVRSDAAKSCVPVVVWLLPPVKMALEVVRAAASAGMEIFTVVETAEPAGVMDCGEKVHVPPEGKPEQARVSACLNPFSGVMVICELALAPGFMVSEGVPAVMV